MTDDPVFNSRPLVFYQYNKIFLELCTRFYNLKNKNNETCLEEEYGHETGRLP